MGAKTKAEPTQVSDKDMQFHEIANIFPFMDEAAFFELVEDIRKNGLTDAIDTYEGKILDGRNRYKACLIAGVPPRMYPYTGDQSPLDYVLSKNMMRRHMTESQRAMVGQAIANLPCGGDYTSERSVNLQTAFVPVEKAAEVVKVSPSLIHHGKRVATYAHPSINDAVCSGKLKVSTAAKFTRLVPDKEKQARILKTQGVDGITDIVSANRKKKQKVARPDAPVVADTETASEDAVRPEGSSMHFARLAISHLSRIADWDTHKFEAVKLVKEWIAERERYWSDVK